MSPRRTIQKDESSNVSIASPLSFGQEQLWLSQQLEPGSPAYNLPFNVRLGGTLNVAALERSLNEIRRRHEVLRARFTEVDGQPVQIITEPRNVALPIVDLQNLPDIAREAEARRRAFEEAQRPFDLTQGNLLRVVLLRLGPEDHILVRVMHHIVCDGWSINRFLQELTILYEAYCTGKPASLSELPIRHTDFVHLQRQRQQSTLLESQLSYWKRQLAGNLSVLSLPTDRPRPTRQLHRGACQTIELPAGITEALRALSRNLNMTLFMTLLAAFACLLHRHTGQNDILIGTAIANRNRTETRGLIGFMINIVALRNDLSGNPSFRELLTRVRTTALGAYAHQDLSLGKLLEELRPTRGLTHSPLFQVFLTIEPAIDKENLVGLSHAPFTVDVGSATLDLSLQIVQHDTGLLCHFRHSTDLFDETTIQRMAGHFRRLLEGIVADPEQRLSSLPLLTEQERNRLSAPNRGIRPDTPFSEFTSNAIEQSIPARFEQQVKKYPYRLAIKTRTHEWTYQELNSHSNQVAHAILMLCGKGEDRVALLFEHGAPMVAGLLGVLKAGKCYVPLDSSYPRDRLAYMLTDARAGVVLTNRANVELAIALTRNKLPIINIDEIDLSALTAEINLPVAPDAIAYILYTSGSTGQPKGVVQNHRNVLHFIRAYTNNLHINADDRLTLFSSYSFDAAVMDIFGALLNGAALYPLNIRAEGVDVLGRWLTSQAITLYHSTPTVYRYFTDALSQDQVLSTVRMVVLGGEEVYKRDLELYKKHFPSTCLFVNGLGPTESTVSLQYFMDKQTEITRLSVPVGYPVDNTEVIMLDEAGDKTEFYGEIAVVSAHVALGYWQQPELTQARFHADSTGSSQRIYRTGDMGRLLPDGSLEFLGRNDAQVKLRGFRIELGEVEAALNQHPNIRASIVIAREDIPGDKRLVAYIIPSGEAMSAVDPASELRIFLRQTLPDYMLPAAFVVLDEMPLTPSGKVDRQALPAPDQTSDFAQAGYQAPRTPTEETLSAIWAEVLERVEIGIHDNFFELDGHSLLATRVISRIRTAFQIELPLRALFENPTIAKLSLVISEQQIECTNPAQIAGMLDELSDAEIDTLLTDLENRAG